MRKYLFFCFTISLIVNGSFAESIELTSDKAKNVSAIDICTLQLETGACKKRLKRYYYNAQHKICTFFTYSGCGANSNNFKTKQDCQNNCPGKYLQTVKPLYCMYAPDKGNCNKQMPRYYYNAKKNTCDQFVYGECGGNNNRFSTIEECRIECKTYEFSLQMKSD